MMVFLQSELIWVNLDSQVKVRSKISNFETLNLEKTKTRF